VQIARIAQASGIVALAVHGRTRADFFTGVAEFDTIREIKSNVAIPIFANGDIDDAQKAQQVLDFTGADGVMIGRASHGAPWIFRSVNAHLRAGNLPPALLRGDVRDIILAHLDSLYRFYGEESGVRIARKHLGWYCAQLFEDAAPVRRELLAAADTAAQFAHAARRLDEWVNRAAGGGPQNVFPGGGSRNDRKEEASA
jgi:tRNA-dihydrouridine synthase B